MKKIVKRDFVDRIIDSADDSHFYDSIDSFIDRPNVDQKAEMRHDGRRVVRTPVDEGGSDLGERAIGAGWRAIKGLTGAAVSGVKGTQEKISKFNVGARERGIRAAQRQASLSERVLKQTREDTIKRELERDLEEARRKGYQR